MFESLTQLTLASAVGSIPTDDLFKSFSNLGLIRIQMDSLRNFFHLVGLEWTLYLNLNVKSVDLTNVSQLDEVNVHEIISIVMSDNSIEYVVVYKFDKYFPNQRLVPI